MNKNLCGMLGKMRERDNTAQKEAKNKFTNRTDTDVSKLVKEYAGLGGKRYKIHRKSKKSRK
jgi:hypothetical protein